MMQESKLQRETEKFRSVLEAEEKGKATIEKYMRDVRTFLHFLEDRELSKEETIAYKSYLTKKYAPASTNSMLVALNVFLKFMNRQDCCVKLLRIQRQIFSDEEQELTQAEYQRLVRAAKEEQLSLVIQTIGGTGIRISELIFITAEAVQNGKAVVNCKNKTRVIFLPGALQKKLKKFVKKERIQSGPVFLTKRGKPLHRSAVWRSMKALAKAAGVSEKKIFPHNLRHLFARLFYSIEKDIVRLADFLGHSSINTTRIYTREAGHEHIRCLERVQKSLQHNLDYVTSEG